MKRFTTLTFLLIFFCLSINSQEVFYYSNGENKTYLKTIENRWTIYFENGYKESELFVKDSSLKQISGKYFLLNNNEHLKEINTSNYHLSKVLIGNYGDTLFEGNQIVLKYKKSTTQQERQYIESTYDLTLIKEASFYTLYEADSALSYAAQIYESGKVKFCHPNFLFKPRLNYTPNDTYYNKQFYLHNTGQVINDNLSGVADADIDAPEAWNITKGDTNVIVAVLDRGITSNHPDLPNSRQLRLPGANLSGVHSGVGADDLSSSIPHGTECAGIVAAEQDNNEGISGVAPKSKIMPVKFEGGASAAIIADCIAFADTNDANITSGSFTFYYPYPIIEFALDVAHQHNVVQVYAASNSRGVSSSFYPPSFDSLLGAVFYPAAYNSQVKSIIAVGASNRNNQIASYSPINENIDIVAPSSDSSKELAVTLVGIDVWTTDNLDTIGDNPSQTETLPSSGTNYLDYTGRFGGTSAATPMVAGVAALMFSVNPCLGNMQVKDILLNTADKVGGYNYNWSSTKPGHSKEMGYGKVNAYQAVLSAQDTYSSSLDLMTKDVPNDFGVEPNTVSTYMYISEDIWVRNQADGIEKQFHENPEYDPVNPVYVYVRVWNKSCVDATVNDSVRLYWAKAATSLNWPNHWDGSMTSPALMGSPISTMSVGNLKAGRDTILSFEWYPPNPDDYDQINAEPWHFCLLSRIISSADPMSSAEVSNLWLNVANNNNIAWKNISVLNKPQGQLSPYPGLSAVVAIGNNDIALPKTIDLTFHEGETALFDVLLINDAEVTITLDENALDKWIDDGQQLEGVMHLGDGVFQITNEPAAIKNLQYQPGEWNTLLLAVNFLTEEIGEKVVYKYHLEQFESGINEIIGGEQYLVHRDERELFVADAGGNESVNKGQSINLKATDIGEDAIYNWYDESGKLIYTGKDTSFIPDNDAVYTLEVIARSDGYKDYDKKWVEVKSQYIVSCFPNPLLTSTTQFTVEYVTENVKSAYLNVSNTTQTISNNYIINPSKESVVIDLSSLSPGSYVIKLVCDGLTKDVKTITKN